MRHGLLLLPALATLVLSGPIELATQYFGAREPETRHGLLTNSLVVSGIGGIAAALALLLVGAVGTRFGGTWLELVLTVATIPLVARIVRACDAFSAITTDRPYRQARSVAEAVAELQRCSGTDFDPTVVAALATSVTA